MAIRRIGKRQSQESHTCALCERLGLESNFAEYHHFRDGRLGKRGVVGCYLCVLHHRVGPLAIHTMGKKAWLKHFGLQSEQDLLEG
jgi:hypothetical protein